MQLALGAKEWLAEAGFTNHCFISYARGTAEMKAFTSNLEADIREELTLRIAKPNVFIDHGIAPGNDWKERLHRELMSTIVMVAVVVPVYFEPEHKWCGREWSTISKLAN